MIFIFLLNGISNLVTSVKNESLNEETIDSASKISAVAIGGDKLKSVITGDTPDNAETTEEPKKKRYFN